MRVASEPVSLCSSAITPEEIAPINKSNEKLSIKKKLSPLPKRKPVCVIKTVITRTPSAICAIRQKSKEPHLSKLRILLRNEINRPIENKPKIEKPDICL